MIVADGITLSKGGNKMQWGIEVEFFLKKKGQLVYPADYGIPYDGFPVLGELRTSVHSDEYLLIGEVMGLLAKYKAKAKYGGAQLIVAPRWEYSRDEMREVMRRPELSKGPAKEMNLYKLKPRQDNEHIYAGLHVHFSGTKSYYSTNKCEKCERDTSSIVTYGHLDIPAIVRYLDELFFKEIVDAGRTIGEYEMKPYGFEYRSLPNNVSLDKLALALGALKTGGVI